MSEAPLPAGAVTIDRRESPIERCSTCRARTDQRAGSGTCDDARAVRAGGIGRTLGWFGYAFWAAREKADG